MVARGGEWNDCVRVWMTVSDDLIINDPPIRRIINSFETLKTVSDIVDWLKGAERLREITRMRSWRNSIARRCISQEQNHSVLSTDLSLSVEVFLTVAVGCHVSALCVMFGCDALIIACHFSFPSHSFTSAFFSFYL